MRCVRGFHRVRFPSDIKSGVRALVMMRQNLLTVSSLFLTDEYPTTSILHRSILQVTAAQHSNCVYNQYIPRYFQHAHFIPLVGVGKERRILILFMVTCQGSTRSELP